MRIQVLRERRIGIINLLNRTADELTEINTLAQNAELIGATVSLVGGLTKLFSTWLSDDESTSDAIAKYSGYAEVAGAGISKFSHLYNEVESKKYLENLQRDLQRDAQDLAEIGDESMLENLENALKRLDRSEAFLSKLIQVGSIGQSVLNSSMSEDEALQKIKKMFEGDRVITGIINHLTNSINPTAIMEQLSEIGNAVTSSINDNTSANIKEIDWVAGASSLIETGMDVYRFGKQCNRISSMVPFMSSDGDMRKRDNGRMPDSSMKNFVNGITVTMDAVRLIELCLDTKQPEYIQQIRDQAKNMQDLVNRMPIIGNPHQQFGTIRH